MTFQTTYQRDAFIKVVKSHDLRIFVLCIVCYLFIVVTILYIVIATFKLV